MSCIGFFIFSTGFVCVFNAIDTINTAEKTNGFMFIVSVLMKLVYEEYIGKSQCDILRETIFLHITISCFYTHKQNIINKREII